MIKSPRGETLKKHTIDKYTELVRRIGRAGNPVSAHKSFLKLKNGVFKIKKNGEIVSLTVVMDGIPSESGLDRHEGDCFTICKILPNSNILLTWGLYIFFQKNFGRSWDFRIDVFFKFSEYITRCLHYDTLDGFGYSGVERRCGKIPNMPCMSHVSMGIWIDIRVRLRWFQPYYSHRKKY